MRGCSCRGTAGFAHVSCLAEQAKILVADAEERHLDDDQWGRWSTCSLCGQDYHSIVSCAFGWACWKTYLGRPETDWTQLSALRLLGNGLHDARHDEAALSVREAELATLRRLGAPEEDMLGVQTNLAGSYVALGRLEESSRMLRDVYSGRLKLSGEEHEDTLSEANNYANSLVRLQRFEEAKSLLLKTLPVARRVLSDNNEATLRTRWIYATALYENPSATLDDLRESVTTLEETALIARRVLGGAHPLTSAIEGDLREPRAALRAREHS